MTETIEVPKVAKPSRRRQVQAMLRKEDATSMRGSFGRFFKGIGVCLLGGIVFTTIGIFAMNAMTDSAPLHWRGWFGIYILLLGIGLFLLYRHSHPAYVVAALTTTDDDDPIVAASRRSPILGALLWGPQSVVDGIAAIRGNWTPRQNAMFLRAAELVLEMAKFDGGVEIRSLLHPPEDMFIFNRVVDWLDDHDYLGKSSDGERFWLTTIGKDRLTAHGIKPREFKV